MIQRSIFLLCVTAYCSSALVRSLCQQNSKVNFQFGTRSKSLNSRLNSRVSLPSIYSLKAAATSIVAVPVATASASPLMNSPITKHVITITSMAFASISGCLNPSIIGGLLSGGLHAVSGPDHLAALLPPSVGKPGWYGLKLGATWGLGHGVSAIFLGMCAFFLKGRMSEQFSFLQRLSKYTEALVGLSLFVIGAIGIRENLELRKEMKTNSENGAAGSNSGSEPISRMSMTTFKSSVSIFLNGILHGFSWDGAPSIAPALAMTSWRSAFSFLLSYCIGTMAAMSFTAGAFGEGSLRLGKAFNNEDLPMNLSFASSLVAIIIGIYWVVQALILR